MKKILLILFISFCEILNIESCTILKTTMLPMTTSIMITTTVIPSTTTTASTTTPLTFSSGWQNNGCDWKEFNNYKWYPLNSVIGCRLNCTRTISCTHYSFNNPDDCYIYFGSVNMANKYPDPTYICGSIV